MIRTGAVGEGVDRSPAMLDNAAKDDEADIEDNVRWRSWPDLLKWSWLADGWVGIVAFDCADDVDVRLSCR